MPVSSLVVEPAGDCVREPLNRSRKQQNCGAAAVTMEHAASKRKQPLLAMMLVLACLLLLPLVSSAPLSRSLSLKNNQPSRPGLPAQQDVVVGADHQLEPTNYGEVAARMDIEVNDYPGSGANNRHDPRSPGRP